MYDPDPYGSGRQGRFQWGADGESPFGRLTIKRAAIGIAALLVLVVVVTVLADDDDKNSPYFNDVRDLRSRLVASFEHLAPRNVRDACVAGDAAACAQHEINAEAAAARVDDLTEEFEELGLLVRFGEGSRGGVPSRAAVWNAEYLAALRELEAAVRAQAEALGAGDVAGFEAAVAETDAALAAEEVLNDRFNSEFADEFSAVEDPDAPAANERGSDAGAAD